MQSNWNDQIGEVRVVRFNGRIVNSNETIDDKKLLGHWALSQRAFEPRLTKHPPTKQDMSALTVVWRE